MKKFLFPLFSVILFSNAVAQSYNNRVGINTTTPQTTLDVTAPAISLGYKPQDSPEKNSLPKVTPSTEKTKKERSFTSLMSLGVMPQDKEWW